MNLLRTRHPSFFEVQLEGSDFDGRPYSAPKFQSRRGRQRCRIAELGPVRA